jgi:hypothetical protein
MEDEQDLEKPGYRKNTIAILMHGGEFTSYLNRRL